MDRLEQKATSVFARRVVRKDLVRQTKTGFNVPVYVLEYLLGQYCSSTDPEVIAQGLEHRHDAVLPMAIERRRVEPITNQPICCRHGTLQIFITRLVGGDQYRPITGGCTPRQLSVCSQPDPNG